MNNSCTSYYKTINLQDTRPTKYIISHPDGRSWKLDGNILKLNTGNQISLQKYNAKDVYNTDNGRVGLFIDGIKIKALRHNNYFIVSGSFESADYFSWLLIPNEDGYKIYNDWGGGYYIGYNTENDSLMILSPGDARIVVWNIDEIGGNENKTKLKALAHMVKGKALYSNVKEYQDVNMCILPNEVKEMVSVNNCLLTDVKGTVLRNNLIATKGGTLNDSDKGAGIYPSDGCGIISDDSDSFNKMVEDVSGILDKKTKDVLKSYKLKLSNLDSEIRNLVDKEIPNKTKELNEVIQKYNDQKRICDSYKPDIDTITPIIQNLKDKINKRQYVSDVLVMEDKKNIDINNLNFENDAQKNAVMNIIQTKDTFKKYQERISVLKKVIKCYEPQKAWIFSPNYKAWRYNDGNPANPGDGWQNISLNAGTPLPLTLATGYQETYGHGLGFGLLFMIDRPGGNWTWIIRHAGLTLRAQTNWGTDWHNNWDHAWKFERVVRKPYTNEMINTQFKDYLLQDKEGNIYNNYAIRNLYGGETYIGYDASKDRVLLVGKNDPNRTEWIIMTAWGW